MKYSVLVLAALLPCVALAEIPTRKEGLWEVSIQAGQVNQTVKQCTDAATDAAMMDSVKGADKFGVKCTKNETKQVGSAWITDGDCTMGANRVISHAELTGDFQSNYKGVIKAKYEPPLMGQSESTTLIAGKYVGACGADQKPGDIIMGNGMKMNIASIMAGAGKHSK